MNSTIFPPLATTSDPPLSALSTYNLALISQLILWISFSLLIWDHASHLRQELRLAWVGVRRARAGWWPGARGMKYAFLASRYAAIVQAVAVVVVSTWARSEEGACDAMRYLPFGFSVVSFSTHVVMAMRMFGVFQHSVPILVFLGALSLLDFGVQITADTLIQPSFLSFSTQSANLHVCYLTPSSPYFALVFISPTILHHIILVLSLYASWKHLRVERTTGTSVMLIVRRDQLLYVLAICLVNFVNVVLVLQQAQPEYKLINFFPASCLTQMFLGRLFFSLRAYSTEPHPHSFLLPERSSRALHQPLGLDTTFGIRPTKIDLPPSAAYHGKGSLDIVAADRPYETWSHTSFPSPSPGISLGERHASESSDPHPTTSRHSHSTSTSSSRRVPPPIWDPTSPHPPLPHSLYASSPVHSLGSPSPATSHSNPLPSPSLDALSPSPLEEMDSFVMRKRSTFFSLPSPALGSREVGERGGGEGSY